MCVSKNYLRFGTNNQINGVIDIFIHVNNYNIESLLMCCCQHSNQEALNV